VGEDRGLEVRGKAKGGLCGTPRRTMGRRDSSQGDKLWFQKWMSSTKTVKKNVGRGGEGCGVYRGEGVKNENGKKYRENQWGRREADHKARVKRRVQ